MTTILWLIRHPEPEKAAVGRCYGSLDVALSAAGAVQARGVARALAGMPLTAIYSSPRRRCSEAASILAAGRSCAMTVVDGLRELDFGEFEGRMYDEIAAEYPEIYQRWMEHSTEVQFPGGESFSQMRVRVTRAVQELRRRHEGAEIALVTHGGVNRIVLAEALAMSSANLFRIGQDYGCINCVRYFDELPLVELVNGRGST